MLLHADWALTMGLGGRLPVRAITVGAWSIPDSARPPDRRSEPSATRSSSTLRLEKLLPGLAAEFESRHTPDEIRACADAILAEVAGAPVRSHVAVGPLAAPTGGQ